MLGSLTAGFGLAAPFAIYGVALLVAAAVVFFSLRHSSVAAPADGHRSAGDAADCVAPPGVSVGAVLQLRDGLVGVRPAYRVGAVCSSPRCCIGGRASPGLALATFAVGNVAAVIPSGYLSDRIGRRTLLIVGPDGVGGGDDGWWVWPRR